MPLTLLLWVIFFVTTGCSSRHKKKDGPDFRVYTLNPVSTIQARGIKTLHIAVRGDEEPHGIIFNHENIFSINFTKTLPILPYTTPLKLTNPSDFGLVYNDGAIKVQKPEEIPWKSKKGTVNIRNVWHSHLVSIGEGFLFLPFASSSLIGKFEETYKAWYKWERPRLIRSIFPDLSPNNEILALWIEIGDVTIQSIPATMEQWQQEINYQRFFQGQQPTIDSLGKSKAQIGPLHLSVPGWEDNLNSIDVYGIYPQVHIFVGSFGVSASKADSAPRDGFICSLEGNCLGVSYHQDNFFIVQVLRGDSYVNGFMVKGRGQTWIVRPGDLVYIGKYNDNILTNALWAKTKYSSPNCIISSLAEKGYMVLKIQASHEQSSKLEIPRCYYWLRPYWDDTKALAISEVSWTAPKTSFIEGFSIFKDYICFGHKLDKILMEKEDIDEKKLLWRNQTIIIRVVEKSSKGAKILLRSNGFPNLNFGMMAPNTEHKIDEKKIDGSLSWEIIVSSNTDIILVPDPTNITGKKGIFFKRKQNASSNLGTYILNPKLEKQGPIKIWEAIVEKAQSAEPIFAIRIRVGNPPEATTKKESFKEILLAQRWHFQPSSLITIEKLEVSSTEFQTEDYTFTLPNSTKTPIFSVCASSFWFRVEISNYRLFIHENQPSFKDSDIKVEVLLNEKGVVTISDHSLVPLYFYLVRKDKMFSVDNPRSGKTFTAFSGDLLIIWSNKWKPDGTDSFMFFGSNDQGKSIFLELESIKEMATNLFEYGATILKIEKYAKKDSNTNPSGKVVGVAYKSQETIVMNGKDESYGKEVNKPLKELEVYHRGDQSPMEPKISSKSHLCQIEKDKANIDNFGGFGCGKTKEPFEHVKKSDKSIKIKGLVEDMDEDNSSIETEELSSNICSENSSDYGEDDVIKKIKSSPRDKSKESNHPTDNNVVREHTLTNSNGGCLYLKPIKSTSLEEKLLTLSLKEEADDDRSNEWWVEINKRFERNKTTRRPANVLPHHPCNNLDFRLNQNVVNSEKTISKHKENKPFSFENDDVE